MAGGARVGGGIQFSHEPRTQILEGIGIGGIGGVVLTAAGGIRPVRKLATQPKTEWLILRTGCHEGLEVLEIWTGGVARAVFVNSGAITFAGETDKVTGLFQQVGPH